MVQGSDGYQTRCKGHFCRSHDFSNFQYLIRAIFCVLFIFFLYFSQSSMYVEISTFIRGAKPFEDFETLEIWLFSFFSSLSFGFLENLYWNFLEQRRTILSRNISTLYINFNV